MSSIVRIAAALVAASVPLTMAGGISAATEDPLIGKTYSAASAVVAGWKGTPKIATVIGSRLPTEDCLVSSWHKSSSLDSAGNRQQNIVLINLNCSGPTASAGLPTEAAES